ncbi:MAG: hypothetical protein HY805_11205 [Nitrospirae bacterium]|nr:hypothetical protein [Nitrospirota bacterium]
MKAVDIHIHGISGFDTRTKDPKDILEIASLCGKHGVTEIIPTIYPARINIMRENIMAVKMAMETQRTKANENQSRIIGVNLEGPFLNPLKCGALNSSSFILPTEYNFKELIGGFEDVIKIMTIAPELEGAVKLIGKAHALGIIVSMGHSDATYNEAEEGFKAGAKGITHIFNAMSGFHHREHGLSGFGLLNDNIYIEVIGDPYHLHPKTIQMIFRLKSIERIILVSDLVANPSSHGLSGGSMTVREASNRLIELGIDKEAVAVAMSGNPERYLYG